MEIAFFAALIIFLLLVAVSPAWLMWLLAAKWLPAKYAMPPNRMAFVCFLLSFISGALLNIELQGGILSAPVFILVFSILWSVLLIPICALTKYIRGNKHGLQHT